MNNIRVLQIPDLLNAPQCQKLIGQMEADPILLEPVKTRTSLYARIYLHLPELAGEIWNGIRDRLCQQFPEYGKDLVAIRPIWSATKYLEGGYLGPHVDGESQNRGYRSKLTIVLYLNDEFEGGETNFYPDDEAKELLGCIIPETGMAIILPQDVFHSGEPITSGTKYILRSDILIKDTPPNLT